MRICHRLCGSLSFTLAFFQDHSCRRSCQNMRHCHAELTKVCFSLSFYDYISVYSDIRKGFCCFYCLMIEELCSAFVIVVVLRWCFRSFETFADLFRLREVPVVTMMDDDYMCGPLHANDNFGASMRIPVMMRQICAMLRSPSPLCRGWFLKWSMQSQLIYLGA